MNPELKEFEQIRRLLAIKRHEQPPPGYFHSLPGTIMSRIRAGERGEARRPAMFWEVSWIERIWSLLETKPAFAGGFGVAICAGLFAAILYSEKVETVPGYAVQSDASVTTASAVLEPSTTPVSHPFIDRNLGLTLTELGTNASAPPPSLFNEDSSVHPVLVNQIR